MIVNWSISGGKEGVGGGNLFVVLAALKYLWTAPIDFICNYVYFFYFWPAYF